MPKACTKYKSVTRDPTSDNLDQYNPHNVGGGQLNPQDSLGYQFNAPHQDEHSNITCQVISSRSNEFKFTRLYSRVICIREVLF